MNDTPLNLLTLIVFSVFFLAVFKFRIHFWVAILLYFVSFLIVRLKWSINKACEPSVLILFFKKKNSKNSKRYAI